jgi:hypothetical protein
VNSARPPQFGVPVVDELRGAEKSILRRVRLLAGGRRPDRQWAVARPAACREVTRWLLTGQGISPYSASLAAASVRVLEGSETLDVQCSIAPPASRTVRSTPSDDRGPSAHGLVPWASGPFRGSTISGY